MQEKPGLLPSAMPGSTLWPRPVLLLLLLLWPRVCSPLARSQHVKVRKCAAELLLSLMQRIGVTELPGTARAERLANAAGMLAQDRHKDTR